MFRAITSLIIGALLVLAQESDQERATRIEGLMRKNAPISDEERAFMQQYRDKLKVEWAKTHPQHDSLGMVPLTDLGKGMYHGEQGGLYPNGENVPPPAHLKAGIEAAKSVQPVDGKIVMISIGMSNTTIESQVFADQVKKASGINPPFQFVDCAQGGQVAGITANPKAKYWDICNDRLTKAGVSPKQVQVAWVKQASANPTQEFPTEAKKLQGLLKLLVQNAHEKYPNLKIVYFSSRIYAGLALSPLNPEPHAYEGGFAVKWLIADQIKGDPDLKAPWLAWGPYLWADGVKPRSDGLTWVKDDFVESDRTHPSMAGREKVAKQLLDFLRTNPTSTPWFLAK